MSKISAITTLLVVATGVVASSGRSRADAGFACVQASSPIEKLICGNHELADLDGSLARAFAEKRGELGAEFGHLLEGQRSWLKSRNATCHIPARGGDLTPEQQDAATKCLVKLYRERIDALGEQSDKGGAPEAETAAEVPGQNSIPYGEDVVAYYSADDSVCQPLEAALSAILRNELGATDFLDRNYNVEGLWRANEERLKREGFTVPVPLNRNGSLYASTPAAEQDTQYDLDLANDGHLWRIVFEDLSAVGHATVDTSNRWFVLKPGRPFRPAKKSGLTYPLWEDKVTEPAAEDVAVRNYDPDTKGMPEALLAPLNPKFRKRQFQYWDLKQDDPVSSLSIIGQSGLTRPLQYRDAVVYMLSSLIAWGNANKADIALTKFTSDLKPEAVCLFASKSDFK